MLTQLFGCRQMLAIILFGLLSTANLSFAEQAPRYFLFIGEPNAAAWKYLMDNPVDRRQQVDEAMSALGGKILSYYFGMGNGKNYITVELPDDNEVIQAVYLMRMPSGLLTSYEFIELMPSEQMVSALRRSKEFLEVEKKVNSSK